MAARQKENVQGMHGPPPSTDYWAAVFFIRVLKFFFDEGSDHSFLSEALYGPEFGVVLQEVSPI